MNRTLWSLASIVCLTIGLVHAQGPGSPRVERLDPRLDQLLPPELESEVVATGMVWAEGPLWDAAAGALLFSDVARNAIFRWHPGTGVRLFLARSGDADDPPRGRESGSNGLAFDTEGRLTWCQHGLRRVVRREKDGSLTVLADRFNGRRLNSPNDLVFDRAGNLYFTDPVFGLPGGFDDPERELDRQAVYRLTPDGTLTAVVTDLRLPNGIALSPDERVLYVSNAQRSRPVWMAYDLAPDGTARRGRVLADAGAWVRPQDNVPDGMKVDRDGHLFATGPGGIHVLAPDGTRLGRIETFRPTSNVGWGPDGWLYVTAGRDILRLRTRTGPPGR
jgi:gluconolactonase